MKTLFFSLEMAAMILVLYLLIFGVVEPMMNKTPLFPMFRRKQTLMDKLDSIEEEKDIVALEKEVQKEQDNLEREKSATTKH
jgi:hypothetical protein